jgi:16S rRNA (cytidine1402-2'-O)-methyltransferase
MVATPIGNLADITLRALHVLQQADTVFCEDTRQGAALLRAYGLHKPTLALHQHNEHQATTQVLARLEAGQRVAYVSDAGTPGISDPGARLCATVQDAGWRVLPLPGASSVTALLGACGALANDGRFVFVGFLPAKGAARQHTIDPPLTAPSCRSGLRLAKPAGANGCWPCTVKAPTTRTMPRPLTTTPCV